MQVPAVHLTQSPNAILHSQKQGSVFEVILREYWACQYCPTRNSQFSGYTGNFKVCNEFELLYLLFVNIDISRRHFLIVAMMP